MEEGPFVLLFCGAVRDNSQLSLSRSLSHCDWSWPGSVGTWPEFVNETRSFHVGPIHLPLISPQLLSLPVSDNTSDGSSSTTE